jgi:hypothetical protein
MLQIDTTIAATTKIEPGKLAIGESEAGGHAAALDREQRQRARDLHVFTLQGEDIPYFALGIVDVAPVRDPSTVAPPRSA